MCCYVTLGNIRILINAYENVYPLFNYGPAGKLEDILFVFAIVIYEIAVYDTTD